MSWNNVKIARHLNVPNTFSDLDPILFDIMKHSGNKHVETRTTPNETPSYAPYNRNDANNKQFILSSISIAIMILEYHQ